MFISNDEQTGRFTFEAEGSTNPLNPYFIGKLSHPSQASGVTIGAGYDMGGRNALQVENELVMAGLSSYVAAVLAQGAGLTGDAAGKFVKDNHTLMVEDIRVLRNLFAMDFPRYVTRARASFNYHANNFQTAMCGYGTHYANPTAFSWETLYPSIRVIAIDLVYQGFGRQVGGYGKPIHLCMANNFDWLIHYIETSSGLNKYEAGRRRAPYLRARRDFEILNDSQCTPDPILV